MINCIGEHVKSLMLGVGIGRIVQSSRLFTTNIFNKCVLQTPLGEWTTKKAVDNVIWRSHPWSQSQ